MEPEPTPSDATPLAEPTPPPPRTIVVGQSVVDIHGCVGSSDEEADNPLNRIGDVPLEWYDDELHMGYGPDGAKLAKAEPAALDKLLASTQRGNVERYKTILDRLHNNAEIKLTTADLQILHNLVHNRFLSETYDPYEDLPPDTVKISAEDNPFTRGTTSKRIWVRKPRPAKGPSKEPEFAETSPQFDFDLWKDSWRRQSPRYIAAPETPLPDSAESYNPPPELLPTQAERAEILSNNAEQSSIRATFLPTRYECLRHVPWYDRTLDERYQRCLDLYLFPRVKRQKLKIANPDDLLPRLPAPRDLRPFPELLAMEFRGHTAAVRSMSVSPSGQWLATGCDDHLLRIFEVQSGRLVKHYDLRAPVSWVQFSPVEACPYVAAGADTQVHFFAAAVASLYRPHDETPEEATKRRRKFQKTFSFAEPQADPLFIHSEAEVDKQRAAVGPITKEVPDDKFASFVFPKGADNGHLLTVCFHSAVRGGSIHQMGDYVAVVAPDDPVRQRRVVLLQLETQKAICPFQLRTLCKDGTKIVDCRFFENAPHFLVVTSTAGYVFDLKDQALVRRLRPGVHTSLAAADVHPLSGHVVCASLGDASRAIMFFSPDGDERPAHKFPPPSAGVPQLSVVFHRSAQRFPLLGVGGADGRVSIFHSRSIIEADEDLETAPALVPLRNLKFQAGSQVLASAFHPRQPWIFTASDKGEVAAWVES